jgi:hypothetical protein
MIERIFHKSKNFKEAEDWDIQQQISMSPEERQMVAKELRERVFGKNTLDVREAHKQK